MKPYLPKKLDACRAITLAGLLLPLWQAVAQPSPASPAAPEKDEVLKLNDFIVTSEKATGYRATNSITATGIGMPIGETPLMINVVTKDLIADSRSDLLIDALRFVPGVVNNPTNESQPFVRGFQGTYSLRNGVFRRQNLTTWNVDRVEVIQGSASIFYSNIRPGGVINYITAKPELGKTFADVNASAGSYGYYRGEGAFNVASGNNVAVRVTAGHSETGTFRREFHETQDFFSISALWNITPNHQVMVEAGDEETWRENSWSAYITPQTNSRYWGNPAAIASGQNLRTWMNANFPGMPIYDMFAPFSPRPNDPYGRISPIWDNSFQRTTDKPVDFTYNGKLTDQLGISVVANYAYENNQGLNPNGLGDVFADGTFRSGFRGELFINVRDSYNLNSKVVYRLNFAGMKHTFMAGNDNQWVTQRYPLVNGNLNELGPVIAVFDPRVLRINARTQLSQRAVPFNTIRKRYEYFGGNYIVDQVSMLNDRLFILGGARYVDYKQNLSYIVTNSSAVLPPTPPQFIAKQWTPQIGALAKLAKGVAVFASYSKSIEPQLAIDISAQRTVEPIKGKGFDVGVKLDAMGGALTGTVDYYEIQRDNVAIFDTARNTAAGIPGGAVIAYYTFGNAQKVRGLQTDINWSVNRNAQIIASWNHFLQAENVVPQANPLNIGVPIFYQPKDTMSLWGKYQFSQGALKGFSFGGGLRHNSAVSLGGNFDTVPLINPSFTVVDLLVGYQAKLFDRNVDFRFNVRNAGDKIYREGGAFGADRTFVLSASTRF